MTEPAAKQLVKPRVHHTVVKAIATKILRGEYVGGSPLPPEPDLCEAYSISRSALREAIRVLSEKGLLVARPRVGTHVRPREDWNLLDADLLKWSMEIEPRADIILSLIEARQVIEPAAARFAALRATPKDMEALDAAFTRMESTKKAGDFEAFNEADIDFHKALLRASQNIVFQQFSTTMGAALAYSFRMTIQRAREPGASLPNHGEVAACIRRRDPVGAHAAMARLLNIAVVDLGLTSQ